ncbi:LytTR family DNA-binding domain-containing protein [Undibacterium sp. 5I1]|uniref:LytR/AlgR family response regulator transcription factor n=1 Tax=unclassified Undibacterium TaxID=2630295 RepID=UPI002AB51D36|nr:MULTISPECIES: LytTR family DNA-binding domain-containing protein [unclassified Undibacterium]MDY7539817.1 LytTR family DNA-binding domain-containing protein [Undibacterium sp. 5I1]MEB0232106.1 LytTR family DNA-binding domain-containing protein [Undibacterium sp. 10I3]MEB0256853.1 LytTR family DNA-binding domain-containing protein [Undibacterium sp. 5I1]
MNHQSKPSAILAEDEAVLRQELRQVLSQLWPDLVIVGEAQDGIAAAQLLGDLAPDIAFLDVQMPGMTGIEVARLAAQKSHVVFLTAFDDYAVKAFEQGAVDYLLKPLDLARLAICIQRLKGRLAQQPADLSALEERKPLSQLRWIQASSGGQLRFININDVQCFRADAKYTCVVTSKFEAHIRTPIKDLALQLDTEKFWQISRSAIVNVAAIDAVQRVDGGLALRIHGDAGWIAVSQAFQHQFKQM